MARAASGVISTHSTRRKIAARTDTTPTEMGTRAGATGRALPRFHAPALPAGWQPCPSGATSESLPSSRHKAALPAQAA
eukprot:7441621-Lingulodinium_polyedra.AAC.1